MGEPRVRFVRHPVDGPITGRFGDLYTIGGRTYRHRGVDYGVPVGTPVYAPAAGTVVPCTNDGSFGIAVCLRHDDGWFTIYAHLSRAAVSLGQRVEAGQLIGWSGNTGLSTGPHLHWQLCSTSTFPVDIAYSRDPLDYLVEEEEMDPNAMLNAILSNKPLRDRLVAAVKDDLPTHLALDARARDALARAVGGGAATTGAGDVRSVVDARLRELVAAAGLGTDDLGRALAALWGRVQAAGRALAEAARAFDRSQPPPL